MKNFIEEDPTWDEVVEHLGEVLQKNRFLLAGIVVLRIVIYFI